MNKSTEIEQIDKINTDDKICLNCTSMIWGVALGIGVKCRNAKNEVDGKMFSIPSRNYSCDYFVNKNQIDNE